MYKLGGPGVGRSKVLCGRDGETEICEKVVKSFIGLPPEYWNTPQSLAKVFQEIAGVWPESRSPPIM